MFNSLKTPLIYVYRDAIRYYIIYEPCVSKNSKLTRFIMSASFNELMNTCIVEPPYSGCNWDQVNCPDYRGSPHFRGELVL